MDDGNLLSPNNSFAISGIAFGKWRFITKNKIVYDYYLFGKQLDNSIMHEELFIQDNGDIIGHSYRGGILAFKYYGTYIH